MALSLYALHIADPINHHINTTTITNHSMYSFAFVSQLFPSSSSSSFYSSSSSSFPFYARFRLAPTGSTTRGTHILFQKNHQVPVMVTVSLSAESSRHSNHHHHHNDDQVTSNRPAQKVFHDHDSYEEQNDDHDDSYQNQDYIDNDDDYDQENVYEDDDIVYDVEMEDEEEEQDEDEDEEADDDDEKEEEEDQEEYASYDDDNDEPTPRKQNTNPWSLRADRASPQHQSSYVEHEDDSQSPRFLRADGSKSVYVDGFSALVRADVQIKGVDSPDYFTNTSFSALGITENLVKALEHMNIHKPTEIQKKAVPAILGGANVIVGAATGSGKTLTYLIPVIQRLKFHEVAATQSLHHQTRLRRPRVIVLVPTRELVEQVYSVAKNISFYEKFRLVALHGNSDAKQQKKLVDSPIDVLITTTGRLLKLLNAKPAMISLRDLEALVVDEVDTLFDEGFGPELQNILRIASLSTQSKISTQDPNANTTNQEPTSSLQYVAVGATHPKAAQVLYEENFGKSKRIEVDLHMLPRGLTQRFISLSPNSKLPELVAVLGQSYADGSLDGGRIIVFTNTIKSCRFVDHFLEESGYQTSCIHAEIPSNKRQIQFQRFKDRETQILVCTDVAARGIDNLLIDHVVLFDFPKTAVDYIHRAGRTARAGAKGKVTSLITKRDEKLADAIQVASKAREDTLARVRIKRQQELEKLQAKKNSLKITEKIDNMQKGYEQNASQGKKVSQTKVNANINKLKYGKSSTMRNKPESSLSRSSFRSSSSSPASSSTSNSSSYVTGRGRSFGPGTTGGGGGSGRSSSRSSPRSSSSSSSSSYVTGRGRSFGPGATGGGSGGGNGGRPSQRNPKSRPRGGR